MAIWQVANVKNPSIRKCAFCKHWYDPTNSAIAPKNSISGIWTYEKKTKRKCMIMNYDKPGGALGCPKFECKL